VCVVVGVVRVVEGMVRIDDVARVEAFVVCVVVEVACVVEGVVRIDDVARVEAAAQLACLINQKRSKKNQKIGDRKMMQICGIQCNS
jgi:hypothetical protein